MSIVKFFEKLVDGEISFSMILSRTKIVSGLHGFDLTVTKTLDGFHIKVVNNGHNTNYPLNEERVKKVVYNNYVKQPLKSIAVQQSWDPSASHRCLAMLYLRDGKHRCAYGESIACGEVRGTIIVGM
ncbi:MAG: hypothetical protein ACI9TY_000060 [Alphaproteobacteria bacterium]|jgi:hypothetical protein